MEPISTLKIAFSGLWKAFLHRRTLSYIKNKAYAKISNHHADIWILGRPNTGKSSILTCLLDEIKTSSAPPLTSLKIETGVLLLGESYAKTVRVAPGQSYIFERIKEDFIKSLSTKNPSTLIFVVDFGYNFGKTIEFHQPNSTHTNIEDFQRYRTKQLKIEEDNLDFLLNQIKSVPASLLKIKNI